MPTLLLLETFISKQRKEVVHFEMLIKPICGTTVIYKNVLNLNSELAPRSVKFFFSAAGGGAESKQNSIMCDPLFEQAEISRQAALIVFNSLCLGL